MSNLTAIKVPIETRNHLRDAAKSAGVAQWVLIEQMLKDREDAEFWAAMAKAPALTSEERTDLDAGFLASAADREDVETAGWAE